MLPTKSNSIDLETASQNFVAKPNISITNGFQDESQELSQNYKNLVNEVCNWDVIKDVPGVAERYKTLLNYWSYENVKDMAHHNLSLLQLFAYKKLEKQDRLTRENLEKASIACNVIKVMEVAGTIYDDVYDKADARYSLPSWHKKVGMEQTILDTHFIMNVAYLLLLNNLHDHPQCLNLITLYKKQIFRSIVGAFVDITKVKMEEASTLYQHRLVKVYYKGCTPVRAAMYLANIDDPKCHEKVEAILQAVSSIAVSQKDYFDGFLTDSVSKKDRNDIKQGTNTWFYIKALELGNNSQKEILKSEYGKDNDDSVVKVMKIYKDLRLEERYKEYSKDYIEKLHKKVDNELPKELPKQFFHDYIEIIKDGFLVA